MMMKMLRDNLELISISYLQ